MTTGDVVLLPVTATNLVEAVLRALEANGQRAEVTEETVAGFKLLKLTVVGRRKNEGTTAATVKALEAL